MKSFAQTLSGLLMIIISLGYVVELSVPNKWMMFLGWLLAGLLCLFGRYD
jgi:hypothetical protein